ncbi:MAG: DUF4270 family protein [Polaribacter sp.]|uniref:DUF4270 family protein n=1 Tax=Polaribacter sp. TaxID=1920175 RepID=UPI003262D79B
MKYYIIGVLSLFFLVSCNTDEKIYEVGGDFIESEIQVRVIDTFSIKAGTYKLDSLITSNTNRILLGNVIDDKLGTFSSKSYMQLITSTYTLGSDAIYDSIGMILNYDNYYYGDTTKIQTYKLHRITETVEPKEGVSFYNTSSLKYDSDILGQISFTPNPNKATDSLFIKMDDALGQEIFDKIDDNDINNSDDFLQYFKGLAIIPETNQSNHILGFNAQTAESTIGNSSMRLYYTIKDDDNEDNNYFIDFVISGASKQFNQISSDLSSTTLKSFVDEEEIKLSTETDNLIFTQSGTGISARIDIPSIKKLSELAENATTLSADLTFKPLKGSYSEDNPLPETLSVFIVDNKNRIIQQLTDEDGNAAYAVLIKEDDEFDENTYYTVDLSNFVELILYSEQDLNYALMIQYQENFNNVNSVVIEHNENTNNEVKLSVEYLNY